MAVRLMRRDPRSFSIWATIVRTPTAYEVKLSGLAVDPLGPEERFTEMANAATLDDAVSLRLKMVKDICARLEKAGSRVAMVELGQFPPRQGSR